MPRKPPLIRAILTLLIASQLSCQTKEEARPSPARAEEPALQALRAATEHAWRGPFGQLDFHPDGTATFAIATCSYEELSPGIIDISPQRDCTTTTYTGELTIKPHAFGLRQEDGLIYLFAAYLDDQGQLHLNVGGDVFPIQSDRSGVIPLTPRHHLHLGTPCHLEDTFEPQRERDEIPCDFIESGELQVFTFQERDPFNNKTLRPAALLYLPALNLLVSPDLHAMVFSPSD